MKLSMNLETDFGFRNIMNDTIHDRDTNVVFIADTLASMPEFKNFHERLLAKFNDMCIEYEYIPGTKDVWCRDYMPVQLMHDKFIGYRYMPDYLMRFDEDREYISDQFSICQSLGIVFDDSGLVLDGGNVVVCDDKVVLTDKIYKENAVKYGTQDLLKTINDTFYGREPVVIPWNKSDGDPYGHSDGLVRYLGNDSILLSAIFKKDREPIRKVLSRYFKDVFILDFDLRGRRFENYAWAYINFLQVGNKILMPSFGLPCEPFVIEQISQYFNNCLIDTIDMRDVASYGGALHCLTWNIKK